MNLTVWGFFIEFIKENFKKFLFCILQFVTKLTPSMVLVTIIQNDEASLVIPVE